MSWSVLHLTLHRKWFDRIATGEKKFEYREIKPYWHKRLREEVEIKGFKQLDGFKKFDEIWMRNGYGHKSPFMRIEHVGTTIIECVGSAGRMEGHPWGSGKYYCLELGKILEIKNWDGPK